MAFQSGFKIVDEHKKDDPTDHYPDPDGPAA